MKKKNTILLFGFVFSSLFSCGGYEKSSKLVISTLNYDSNFSLKVPVYQAQLGNGVSFYYQDGYSKESLYSSLDKEGYSYEECGKYLFFRAIVNKKVKHFVVEENENGNMRFAVRKDMAENYNYDVDKLLDRAAANTQERYQPVLKDMGSVILSGPAT